MERVKNQKAQFGGGLLPVVAAAGVVMVMTQGTMFYKAKSSATFLADERSKIMAQQAAEAGVESAIAAQAEPVGRGTFTTRLTALALGPDGDTVNLQSDGQVGHKQRTVNAKLRLRNAFDTNQVILAETTPETTYTVTTHLFYDTTLTTTVQDPNAMPVLNTTAAYLACMSSGSKKCDICHLTSSDVHSAEVIEVAKAAIHTHIGHHGDYVTTDGTCDIYQPQTTLNLTPRYGADTTLNITSTITYDTAMAIDTVVKVQVLSWR
jgi:hypothetical protein